MLIGPIGHLKLSFQYYANYILSIMGKMCAAVRDEQIARIRETTDIVEVYKGILEVCLSFPLSEALGF